jgi:hypothetical protein
MATETAASAGLTRNHHTRANPCALIKVDHVLVRHADAARRNRLSDRIRFIGAMDSIECAREIHGARAEGIVRTPVHMTGKVRPTPQHLGRWSPIRPLSLVPDTGSASPRKPWPSDADAVLERLMVRHDEVESALAGADDDGARRLPSVKRDSLSGDRSRDRLQLRIQGVGEDWRGSGVQKEAGHQGGANQIAAHDSPVKTTDNLNEHAAERVLGPIRWCVIMAGDGPEAMHCGEAEITNRSFPLNCGEEDTSSLRGGIRDLDPAPDEDLNDGGANPSSSWIVDDNGMR